MTLEERIAHIIELDCLTPTERAASILALPELRLRKIRVAVCNAVDGKRGPICKGYDHGSPRA